jgi:hypothetical protein
MLHYYIISQISILFENFHIYLNIYMMRSIIIYRFIYIIILILQEQMYLKNIFLFNMFNIQYKIMIIYCLSFYKVATYTV